MQGKPCCWLKQGKGKVEPGRSRLTSAVRCAQDSLAQQGWNITAHTACTWAGAPPPPPPASAGPVEWPLWVPPGMWQDFFSGKVLSGPANYSRNYSAAEIPLLQKAGSVVPLKTMADQKRGSPDLLLLSVAWAAGSRSWISDPNNPKAGREPHLYEDDGESLAYQTNAGTKFGKGVYSLSNFSFQDQVHTRATQGSLLNSCEYSLRFILK